LITLNLDFDQPRCCQCGACLAVCNKRALRDVIDQTTDLALMLIDRQTAWLVIAVRRFARLVWVILEPVRHDSSLVMLEL
jgi:hypothetical protein